MLTPRELRCIIASLRLLTLAIGILNTAPADVLTTSELIGAELFWDIIIPETLAANEVLIMAPKFLVSVIPSSKRYVRFSFSLYVFEIKSSRDISDTGDRIATAPWWFLFLYLLNFSFGTNANFILFFSSWLISDLNKLLVDADFIKYTLDISFDASNA